jgi:predicted NBD/HSP70 family sugar kinase
MRFYNRQHRHSCGIDLHVKTMYVCIFDATGRVLVHRNVKSNAEAFLETVAPYRDRSRRSRRVYVHVVLGRRSLRD